MGNEIEVGDLWGEPVKGHRRTRHWLLSTTKTVAKAKCHAYGVRKYEFDFTLIPKQFKMTKDTQQLHKRMYARFCEVLFDCIIPNAIIARTYGIHVCGEDVTTAMNQGMRLKNKEWFAKEWIAYVNSMGGIQWVESMMQRPLDLYVYGRLDSGKRKRDNYTLESYVKNKIGKYAAKLPLYGTKNKPKLNLLIKEYMQDPNVADLGYLELKARFKVSNDTINKFKQWLKEAENDKKGTRTSQSSNPNQGTGTGK